MRQHLDQPLIQVQLQNQRTSRGLHLADYYDRDNPSLQVNFIPVNKRRRSTEDIEQDAVALLNLIARALVVKFDPTGLI